MYFVRFSDYDYGVVYLIFEDYDSAYCLFVNSISSISFGKVDDKAFFNIIEEKKIC